MQVAFFSTQVYDHDFFEQYNAAFGHQLTFFEAQLNARTATLATGHDAVCAFVNDQLDRPTIEIIAELGIRIIAMRSAGFNNVDLQAAQEFGLKVVRVPAYSPHAVAEHALAIILTLNRKTHKAYNRVREGNFSLKGLMGFDLYGKTVGVIGTGKIGAIFCEIMMGLGCHVLAFDPYPSNDLVEQGVKYVELNELFEASDIISLHCPLTKDTFHLIDKEAITHMKRGAMLINTSRGALIDTPAVIDGLKSEQLGSLGIDVYEQEENLFFQDLSSDIIQDDQIARLIAFPNVLITAHQSFFTKEAMVQITETTLQNLSDFENHRVLKNEVKL